MIIVRALERFPNRIVKSLFLAGPTLGPEHRASCFSWRKEALSLLKNDPRSRDLTVFCPEFETSVRLVGPAWDLQVAWESAALEAVDRILFWVPRDLETLPGFTTNHEHGEWFRSGKCVFGAPHWAEKNRYLIAKADSVGEPVFYDLEAALDRALSDLGEGDVRFGVEARVPLFVWKTSGFQTWYSKQMAAGNELLSAKVEYSFTSSGSQRAFFWVLAVSVRVGSESRTKSNEFVLCRAPTVTVVMKGPCAVDPDDEEYVVVREFRSACSTGDCFVREFPGGSMESLGPVTAAAKESFEETGLRIDTSRLYEVCTRQVMSSLSAHVDHLFFVELSPVELDSVRSHSASGRRFGVELDGEQTYPEVVKLRDLREDPSVDFRTLGHVEAVASFLRRRRASRREVGR